MTDLNLINLTKNILIPLKRPVSKVKLAKLIYFVFKGLVKDKVVLNTDIKFVRMPLGPVPVNFNFINKDNDIELVIENVGLTYNRHSFSLKNNITHLEFFDKIKTLVNRFINIPTSELVEYSHKEVSWVSNQNGHEFFISPEDLAIPLPDKKNQKVLSPEMEDQLIQAKLVEGMFDEVVRDNSSLEYPDFYSSNKNAN